MSRKSGVDTYQQKMSRNDRFAQMSHQEKIIEQKKKEILAKLEAKRSTSSPPDQESKSNTNTAKSPTEDAKNAVNIFNNDGSFLNTFKNLKDKRLDSKLKSFNKAKDNNEKNNGDDRSDKSNRWSQSARSMSPKDRSKSRISRFSDKFNNLEPKITINTSFNTFTQQNFDFDLQQNVPVIPQNVTGQPLLKNLISSPEITFPTVSQNDLQVVTAQPLLLNVPPPQLVQGQVNNSIVIPSHVSNMLVSSTDSVTVLSTVSLPPNSIISNQITVAPQPANMPLTPPCVPTVELAAIPPPNPIQLQNIPQPEPLNTLTIPQPAPLQVQNIPTPTSLHLNEIPNPKPLDLLAIPTPNEEDFSESGFLKNIPPPNKSIPPPNIPETNITITSHPNNCIPICNLTQQTIAQNLSSAQILVQTLQPLQAGTQLSIQQQHLQSVNNNVANATNMQQNTFAPVISVSLPIGVVPQTSINVSTSIPALMAQPILPPPGMGLTTMPSVNVNCPPPLLSMSASGVHMQNPPPTYMNQPPPMTNQMPPMNVPPPPSSMSHGNQMQPSDNFKDASAVFPPGTPEYEAMASLARMVAQCGPSIEDVVQQRKTQDPNLWFLFHKESEAYRQYQELVEQFRNEIFEVKEEKFNPEDIYDPDAPIEDDRYDMDYQDGFDNQNGNKRKRKSRWGDKEMNIHPPRIVVNQTGIVLPHMIPMNCQTAGQVMLSRITRTDPALVQYAIQTFGSSNLSEDEWKRAEDHYKINLLYQDMVKKREEVERLNMAGKNKYDYDSDEEIEGGTWEHKLREKEMTATELWAQELTRQAEGKHHIGDFLPPEEFKRFMEKSTAAKEGRQLNFSDYKEFKIKEDNIGFKMLQKLGWTEGEGLGSAGKGIIEPVNKGPSREFNQGLGLTQEELNEDEYESYRKRMMLAYRFRPNPLNNPRRPYY